MSFVWRSRWVAAVAAFLGLCGPGHPETARAASSPPAPAAIQRNRELPGTNLFVPGPLRRIRLELADRELERLRRDNRTYVRATFYDGDKVWRDVGVHLKGAAGSMRPIDDRPALTLNFDKFVPDQRYEGLEKIHLNNSVQDGSYLTENICGELFRQAGVPAARACNVRLEFNRRDLGIYVLKEGFDKTFLRQYYANAKGNLYDGGFCRDITEPLDKMSGTAATEQPEVRALVTASYERDLSRRFQRLNELLDMPRFVSFCAMEVIAWDWDGYVLKPNNYRLYWDPDSKKIVFIPHGMDQMFWEPSGPVYPGFNGLVARALLETPEGKRLYRERMAELVTNVFCFEAITNRIAPYAAAIRSAMAEKDKNWAREYDGQVAHVFRLMAGREAHLHKQLALLSPVLLNFRDGVARPGKWVPENEWPDVRMEQGRGPDERETLSIHAAGNCRSAWRCRVQLPAGRYRFEGAARSEAIQPLSDAVGDGAGLRVSGADRVRNPKLVGTAGWTRLAHEFTVAETGAEVVLVCELRAVKGKVWFDLGSLQIVALK